MNTEYYVIIIVFHDSIYCNSVFYNAKKDKSNYS
jgi:hypothetical protein